MIILTITLVTVGILLLGLLIGGLARARMMLPKDHRRISILAEELYAQARINAMTRATIQTARDIVNKNQR
jgi:hypothetical protein